MYVTNKNEEAQMKIESARVVTTLYSYILETQGQLTLSLVVGCGQKIELFQSCMVVLVTCKNEKDPSFQK